MIDADTRRTSDLFLASVSCLFDVSHAVLFGSRARRDHRPDSDVDIAVLLRGAPANFLRTKLALAPGKLLLHAGDIDGACNRGYSAMYEFLRSNS